jgi:Rrf2 family protein
MQIKRETDYAVRCVYYLCAKGDDGIAMVDEIAAAMSVPRSFAAKILQKLTRAGIVTSHQGVKGGFRLAKSPHQISMLDIITVIEGPLALNVCLESKKACGLSPNCRVHPFWFAVRSGVEKLFADLTFDRFLES